MKKKVTVTINTVVITDNLTSTIEQTKQLEDELNMQVGRERLWKGASEKLIHSKVDVIIAEGDYNE